MGNARVHRVALAVAVVFVALRCGGDSGPDMKPEEAPSGSIVDAAHGGFSGFYWLPPITAVAPASTRPFDPDLSPVIRICELSGDGCGTDEQGLLAEVAILSGKQVQVDSADQTYRATWQSKAAGLEVGKRYRMRVRVGAVELGHADLQVVGSPKDLSSVPSTRVGLVKDRPLAIAFRIDTGIAAAFRLAPADISLGAGSSLQLSAQVSDLHGAPLPGLTIDWSSEDPGVAIVDSSGRLTALSPGATSIRAKVDRASDSASLMVHP